MLWCLPWISGKEYPSAVKKFSLAVITLPSRLNSMTAWALLMAWICPCRSAYFIFWSVTSVANFTTLNGLPFDPIIGL